MINGFNKNGFFISRNFLPKEVINLASAYFNLKYNYYTSNSKLLEEISSTIKDGDTANSLNFYSDVITEAIMLLYGEKASEILNISLSPAYSFTRIYSKGSVLIPHIDRPSCEISATCPIMISDSNPSTIFVSNFTHEEVKEKIKNVAKKGVLTFEDVKSLGDYTKVELYPGDVLFYKGTERYHWREPLESELLVQFFMHFVMADGKYKNFIYDRRPFLGYPAVR